MKATIKVWWVIRGVPAGTGLVKLREVFKTDEYISVTHLSRKRCVHAQTKDLWWKSLSTGKSHYKIK